MIYVSSACSQKKHIGQAVEELAGWGFRNIELTGGTRHYPGYESNLLALKKKYDLNLLIHNYFPPPEEPYVMNLASLDSTIYENTLEHLRKAIELSLKFENTKFGFHAGFFVDPSVAEIGKKFCKSSLYNRNDSLTRFIDGVHSLKREFNEIDLYIENNCYSRSNSRVYGKEIPFMLLCFNDYLSLKKNLDFKLLFDVGHLMISAETLELDFEQEFSRMFLNSDYIHISNNDTMHDQNLGLTPDCPLMDLFNRHDWKGKTITLEIYESMEALERTFNLMSAHLEGMNA